LLVPAKALHPRPSNASDDIVNYQLLQIFRFYYRCKNCAAEFTMKTDPKSSDYILELGASRNYEPWREVGRGPSPSVQQQQQQQYVIHNVVTISDLQQALGTFPACCRSTASRCQCWYQGRRLQLDYQVPDHYPILSYHIISLSYIVRFMIIVTGSTAALVCEGPTNQLFIQQKDPHHSTPKTGSCQLP
jgi:hypothetical protein